MIIRYEDDTREPSIFIMKTSTIDFVCSSNHMQWRAIWDKLPECIFENFEIDPVKQGQFQFSKITRVIYPKNRLNQTRDYWLITLNQQTLYIETNIF